MNLLPRLRLGMISVSVVVLGATTGLCSDPLPTDYGGGFLPPTALFAKGSEGIQKNLSRYARSFSDCYRKAVTNVFYGAPDELTGCLARAQGRYETAAVRFANLGWVASCIDQSQLAANLTTFSSTVEAQIWCDETSGVTLPSQFGGGFVPSDNSRRLGEGGVLGDAALHATALSGCYRHGLTLLSHGLPDGVATCVERLQAQYANEITSLEVFAFVPSCLDPVAQRAAWDDYIKGLNSQLYCAN
jgi:hypothetical protein